MNLQKLGGHLNATPAVFLLMLLLAACQGGGEGPASTAASRSGLAEAGWSFLPFIFGVDDAGGRRDQLRAALTRCTTAMARHHRQDQIVEKGRQSWPEKQ